MRNRYGITADTEEKVLPHGTMPYTIMALDEVEHMNREINERVNLFIANSCGMMDDPDLDPVTIDHILQAVQDVLNKSNTGLHIIRPHVTRNIYKKRI